MKILYLHYDRIRIMVMRIKIRPIEYFHSFLFNEIDPPLRTSILGCPSSLYTAILGALTLDCGEFQTKCLSYNSMNCIFILME